MGREKLLEMVDLSKRFPLGKNLFLQAVQDLNLVVFRGETLGLVGESGCGKSTVGKVIVRLYRPSSGEVRLEGMNVHQSKGPESKALCRRMQMIFQDPYASLNPRMTVGEMISEPLLIHRLVSREERKEKVNHLLEMVGLEGSYADRFPHEFSGGQRQRIGIARALSVNPQFIVCDEPVSALDVSIQAQIINLLKELQQRLGLTLLFISHNLSVVKHISHRVAVMYLGRLVELAPSHALYASPAHPYTKALLSAIPRIESSERAQVKKVLSGDVPSPIHSPVGCAFSPRCPVADSICFYEIPPLKEIKEGHFVACHQAW